MSYKPGSFSSVIIAFVLFFACAMQASAQDTWANLTQSERNARIVAQARLDLGLTGGNCKSWAIHVVYTASGNTNSWNGIVRNLPGTATWLGVTSAAYWWDDSDQQNNMRFVTGVAAQNLATVVSGSIIQMRVHLSGGGYSPHTAIVSSNYGGTMYLLESNYATPNVVTLRGPLTYADFLATLENPTYYTVYQIK